MYLMEEERCCLYFPLTCGLKALAVLSLLHTIQMILYALYIKWVYILPALPLLYASWIMIKFLCMDTELNRRGVAKAFILIGLAVFINIWISYFTTPELPAEINGQPTSEFSEKEVNEYREKVSLSLVNLLLVLLGVGVVIYYLVR